MPFGFSLTAHATERSVRNLLFDCRLRLEAGGVPREWLGTVELVWAEALNNVAEHAYAGLYPGPVNIEVAVGDGRISAHIRDNGLPLPGSAVPPGHLPACDGPNDSLPEGGFGWFLIRELCDSVTYWREDGENHLLLVLYPQENKA